MRRAIVLALSVALIASGAAAGKGGEIDAESVRLLEAWIGAVRAHAPGHRDTQVETIVRLSRDQRASISAGMPLFLAAFSGQNVTPRTPAERLVAEMGRGAASNGARAFLARAVALHTDAAILMEVDRAFAVTASGAPPIPANGALLATRPLLIERDGEVIGRGESNWNWPFARRLVDLIAERAGGDPFTGPWYHATTAFMLGLRLYVEVEPHFERGLAVLPRDARLLFDRGCYWEIQGLPRTQALLTDQEIRRIQLRQRPRADSIVVPAPLANERAEGLFRRALRLDPSLLEARVRLARLLGLRSLHREAEDELRPVLAAGQTGPIAFYAHLFSGRLAQGRGRLEDASGHFEAASALFPQAQSALLARAQIALLRSDVAGALDRVEALRATAARAAERDDPWWRYDLGPGRDDQTLLSEMWSSVPR